MCVRLARPLITSRISDRTGSQAETTKDHEKGILVDPLRLHRPHCTRLEDRDILGRENPPIDKLRAGHPMRPAAPWVIVTECKFK